MTKVRYIHGIPPFNGTQKKPALAASPEASQRAAGVPKQAFHNYSRLTDGEFSLVLLMDQLDMLEGSYPEHSAIYQKGRNMIKDALYKGIHSGNIIWHGILDTELATVARTIRDARNKRTPAGAILTGPRTSIKQGIDPFISRDAAIHGDDIIPVPDCQMLLNNYNQLLQSANQSNTSGSNPGGTQWLGNGTNNYGAPSSYGQGTPASTQAAAALIEYNTCVKQQKMIADLNTYLEKSSHHLLYEYILNASGENGVVTAKYVLHKNAVSAFADVTSLSRDNLRLWLRNGVMHNNATHGMPPHTPEELIQAFRANQAHLGEPITVTIAIISLIIAIIQAAAPIINTLVSKIDTDNKIKSAAAGIGTPTFGPENQDWYNPNTPGNNNTGSGNNTGSDTAGSGDIIPGVDNTTLLIGGAAAAAAGLLLLTK